jgi:uncharacterized protein YggE
MNRMLIPALAVLMACASRMLWAQYGGDMADGVTVSGTGQVAVRPNKLEIEISASASAEITADAVQKFRDSLKRSKQTFDKLKIDNLKVVDRGMSITATNFGGRQNGFAMPVPVPQNEGGSPLKQEVVISKSLELTISGIDKLSEDELVAVVARLVDGVRDAGLSTANANVNNPNQGDNQSPFMVMFVADNLAAAQKKATEAAFQNAKEKANHIAEMTGAKLGSATAVEDMSASDSSSTYVTESENNGVIQRYYAGASASDDPNMKSSTLVELPVRSNLRVRFALMPNGGSK